MMAKIEVIAFVSDWKYQTAEPNPDWAMKINESHSKKNGDSWEVIGHTRFTVKAAYGVEIDFKSFKSGDRVKVTGTQVTEERGEYKNLVIKAESVEVLAASGRVSATIAETRKPEYVSDLIVDAPF
jgi:hypothetical protein